MSCEYELVANDTASKLKVTCVDQDSVVINLTGATVELLWRSNAGVLVTRSMTVVDALNGIAEYQFADGELFAPQMAFRVKITDVSSKVLRNPCPIEVPVSREFV